MVHEAELTQFREDARAWLKSQVDERDFRPGDWGVGSDSVAVFHDRTPDEEEEAVALACTWHRSKIEAGWALLAWPTELGGRGMTPTHDRIFRIEEDRFDTPPTPEIVTITLSLVAPTIQVHGSAPQMDRLLPDLLRTDLLCCQLFSEPSAGSDLAGVQCRAVRAGDTWTVNGQKVWTSGAREADLGLLIARSDQTAAKHHGMTTFIVPLDAPGVEIRPIRQMTGGSSFNEVFFDDVALPDAARLGEEGQGWNVALTMLGFERSISGDGAAGAGGSWEQVLALARHVGAGSDRLGRRRLARLYTRFRLLDLMNERARGALAAGESPGPVGSICKLFWTETLTETSDVVSALLGPRLTADTGEWGTFAWNEHLLGAPGYRIAGGSDEIQRNIIGERFLGLPREPRAAHE